MLVLHPDHANANTDSVGRVVPTLQVRPVRQVAHAGVHLNHPSATGRRSRLMGG